MPPQADIVGLQVVDEAVLRALATVARLLDAAKRRHLVGNQPFIDPDDAILQPFATRQMRPMSREYKQEASPKGVSLAMARPA